MKIVMTNTADNTRKVVKFGDVCNLINSGHLNNRERRIIYYRLLNNETIKISSFGGLEFKREIV